jgi:colanic acid biosynthesis glycosyl transferase WcaI
VADPRIIFVNRVYAPSETATSQLLTDLAEALAARRWPVHVITSGAGSGTRNGVVVHHIRPEAAPGGLVSRAINHGRFVRAVRQELAALVQPGDIVVLKTDPPLLAGACTGLVRWRGGLVVQWIQDIYPEIVPAHLGAWTAPLLWPLRWNRNRAWRAADLCLPVGADMLATVRAQGVRPENAVAMPNWAPRELDAVPDATAIGALRREWGVADKFVAVYSGNLGRVHEFATMLDAAGRLSDDPSIVFLVVGSGPRLAEVRSAAERRGLKNFRFLPPQPRANLAVTLAAADVHFVTLRPGFEKLVSPSKLAGILAAGRPALFIGPTDSEIPALLAREQCGASFAPGENEGLARALKELSQDPVRRTTLGRAARECYRRHFSLAAATARWDELLRKLISNR